MSTSVIATKGYETLLHHTTGAEATLTNTDAACAAGVIDLGTHRRLTIWGHVDAGAVGNIVSLKVWLRACLEKPAVTARFYPASKTDDLSTNAVMERAPVAGSPVATLQPAWSQNTMRPFEIRTAAALNAADEIPFRAVFDVSDARWALVTVVQIDAIGTAAKLLAYYSLSSG